MRSLYESISSVIDDQVVIQNTIDRNSVVIDKILNARSEFPMMRFLEENNLRLDKDNVKKIVNKLKKTLPSDAKFGMTKYGVRRLADQRLEDYGTTIIDPKYGYYNINIEYGQKRGYDSLIERILELHETGIYALDIPETKSIIDVLDKHFKDYTAKEEVKLHQWYNLKSEIGGKYRIYSFKDLTKEFIYKH